MYAANLNGYVCALLVVCSNFAYSFHHHILEPHTTLLTLERARSTINNVYLQYGRWGDLYKGRATLTLESPNWIPLTTISYIRPCRLFFGRVCGEGGGKLRQGVSRVHRPSFLHSVFF